MSPSLPAPAPALNVQWLDDFRRDCSAQPPWFWHGYLAPSNVTLLTSQWKAGKTTLLAMLLARMKSGGELAGLPVRPGKALVVSEESPALWLERSQKFDFAGNVCWLCRPFRARPSPDQWLAMIEQILAIHAQVGLSLVAIDPLAAFLPCRSENDATGVMDTLLTLQRLTAVGIAPLMLHHPGKHSTADGRAARGTGALSAWADILMELHWHRPNDRQDRRRRLVAWSRHEATSRSLLIERTEDGADYLLCAEPPQPEDEVAFSGDSPLWDILGHTNVKLTRRDILNSWPNDTPPPDPVTVWRLVERAVEAGQLRREGAGLRSNPFRYWRPALEELWQTDELAQCLQAASDEALRIQTRHPFPLPTAAPGPDQAIDNDDDDDTT